MLKHKRAILVAGLAACGGLTLSLLAADLTLDQIPAKAREALEKLAGNNKIVEVEAEKENGIMVYEAAWVGNGTHTEAEVTEDGVLLEMEESLQPEAVPESIRAAAEAALAGAPSIKYERHTVVFYEVKGKVDGKGKEIKISAGGKVMGDDDEADDDGDDDGDDDDDK